MNTYPRFFINLPPLRSSVGKFKNKETKRHHLSSVVFAIHQLVTSYQVLFSELQRKLERKRHQPI